MSNEELQQWIAAELARLDGRSETRHVKLRDEMNTRFDKNDNRIDGLDERVRGLELAVERVKTILETRKEQAAGLWDRWKYWVTTAIAVAAFLLAWFKS